MPSPPKHSWNWPSTLKAAKATSWASIASTRLPVYGDRYFPGEADCVGAAVSYAAPYQAESRASSGRVRNHILTAPCTRPLALRTRTQQPHQQLECEGRTHNHRERQHVGEELECERLARSEEQRNVQRLHRDLQERQQLLEELQQALKPPKKCLWTYLSRSNNHWGTIGGSLSVTGITFGMRKAGGTLALCTTYT